jgi:hypothetical protein
MSEFITVATEDQRVLPRWKDFSMHLPIVINPPPPNPVTARIMSSISMLSATEQPKHPIIKVTVDMKKQIRRPNMSENRPYSGWKAVLVIRYEVVSQAALLAALKSELMAA